MVPSIMANQTYRKDTTFFLWNGSPNRPWQYVEHADTSASSPKKARGGLDLRPNPFTWSHRTSSIPAVFSPNYARETVPPEKMALSQLPSYSDLASKTVVISLTNEALARFTGKVRKHNANLGVTLASWKQSVNMITDRTNKISKILDRSIKSLEKMSPSKLRRIRAQKSASAVLEGEFGWKPLVDDIQAGFGTLARNPPDSQWVRSVSKGTVTGVQTDWGQAGLSAWYRRLFIEHYRVTVSGRAVITSQNAHLANRLGLLNLPGVAWDLIPWSFVVNMFTNMAQMVNSLTAFAGVDIRDGSTTQSVFADVRQRVQANPAYSTYVGACECDCIVVYKRRYLGIPTPKFQWRVPELNLELAVIAASLMLQKLNRLNRLVGYVP